MRPEGLVVSSWKLETSATTHPVGREVERLGGERPADVPADQDGAPDSSSSAPVSAVVVVFPLVPVIATNSAVIVRYASSTSPRTGTPRARQPASAG